jgi:putative two-component system response regulator
MRDGNTDAGRILVVDDDEQMRRVLGRSLERAGYRCIYAAGAREAHAQLAVSQVALLLCDVKLPGESGLDLTRHVLTKHPDTAALMVSGSDEPELTATALEYGAYGYLVKPITNTALLISVMNALRRRELEIERRAHTEQLEQLVHERTSSLRRALSRLEETASQLDSSREETIRRLSRAMEFRDPQTGEHVDRMSRSCAMIARRLPLDARAIEVASAMHDIGKIGVPDSILLKHGPLSAAERAIMETHPQLGYDLLRDSGSEILRTAATIAWTHHERFDGGGYPRGLAGEDIPLEGRIAAVADVFDALTSDRPYRAAFSVEHALSIMRAERGGHFDPIVLDVFLDALGVNEATAAGSAPR